MAIWVGRCLGRAPWYTSGLEVAPGTAKVWAGIISLVLAQIGQLKIPLASMWSVDEDGMVAC